LKSLKEELRSLVHLELEELEGKLAGGILGYCFGLGWGGRLEERRRRNSLEGKWLKLE
jgi:hypothetical protein